MTVDALKSVAGEIIRELNRMEPAAAMTVLGMVAGAQLARLEVDHGHDMEEDVRLHAAQALHFSSYFRRRLQS